MSEVALYLPAGLLPGFLSAAPFRCEYRGEGEVWYDGIWVDPEVLDDSGRLHTDVEVRAPLRHPEVRDYLKRWLHGQGCHGGRIIECFDGPRALYDETVQFIFRSQGPAWHAAQDWARGLSCSSPK